MIQSFNGQPVSDINSLRNHVAEAQPGSNASVVIVRDGVEKTVPVKLDEADTGKQLGAQWRAGRRPTRRHSASRSRRGPKGLVITGVNPDSRAADAGLQEGDVIVEVNRRPVRSVDELRAAVRKHERSAGAAARRARRRRPVRHRPAE